MTEFVNDSGEHLEYSGEDVLFSKQVASFRNFKIKGDFTVSFKLNNNSQNRKALGYANLQQVGNHAFAPMGFNLIRNGNLAHKGFIIIEDDSGFGGDLGCYFISGNSNWFKAFDFSLNRISNDALQVQYNSSSFWNTYGKTQGIIFPLIDYLYYRQKFDATFGNGNLVRGQGDSIGYLELYPCLYLHTLVKELAKTANIRITGELLTDPFFLTLVMTPTGPDIVDSNTGVPFGSTTFQTGGGPYIKIQSIPDPDLKAVDFIKWLCFSFGCLPTFDEASQALSLDFIDNIKREDAEDWTAYFQDHEVKYSDLQEHNYIKVKAPLETEILAYNKINIVPFGEADVRTKKADESTNDLYSSPFAPVKDDIGPGPLFWATPFVQFLKLTDGKTLTYTAVTDNGDGRARFTVDMTSSGEVGGAAYGLVYRVVDDTGLYTGYHVSDQNITTTSLLSRDATFAGTSTGTIYLQKLTKQETGNRILSCIPSVPYNNVMRQKPGFTVGTGTDQDNVATAYFSKPIYPYGSLNNYQKGLSYGELNFPTYNDISLIDSRWNKIQAFLRNPPVFGYFKLPQKVFDTFNFDKFIFLNHKDLSGYFFVELLEGYKDPSTTIKAVMNYMDGFAALTGYTLAGVKAGYSDTPVPGFYNPNLDADAFDPISDGTTTVTSAVTIAATATDGFWGISYYFPDSGQNISYSIPFSNSQNISTADTTVTSIVSRFPDNANNNGSIKFYKNGVLQNTISFVNGEFIGVSVRYYTFTGVANGDTFLTVITE